MRAMIVAGGLAAVGLSVVGCDTAKTPGTGSATSRTGEQKARDAGAAVGRAADKAADAVGSAADKTAEAANKAGDKIGGAMDAAGDAAKDNVVKPIEAEYPKVEERIKGLTGDAASTAKTKFEQVKKLVGEFRKASADGLSSAKDKLVEAFADLKKAVGL